MKRKTGLVRVGLYLPDIQVKKIKRISTRKGVSASEIIRRMIDEGLEKVKERR